jgi:drug/metabolite transporter (DMT)-like permease
MCSEIKNTTLFVVTLITYLFLRDPLEKNVVFLELFSKLVASLTCKKKDAKTVLVRTVDSTDAIPSKQSSVIYYQNLEPSLALSLPASWPSSEKHPVCTMRILSVSLHHRRPSTTSSIFTGHICGLPPAFANVGTVVGPVCSQLADVAKLQKFRSSPSEHFPSISNGLIIRGSSSTAIQITRGRCIVTRCADGAVSIGNEGVNEEEAEPRNKFLTGILWFFAHQIIGVGNDVIMKYTGGTLGVAQVVFLRFAFATLTMLPVMFASGLNSFKTDRVTLHIARSFLLAAGIALYCEGLSLAPIAVVTTLNFTIPLFTLVLARMFLSERVDRTRWAGTILGFIGVTIVVQPWGAFFNPMWLVVLLSASMFACLDVLNKVFVGKESFWAMIFYTAFFTTLIAAYPAYLSWVQPTAVQVGLLSILGAGANLLLYCLLKSFSLLDASALAPFRYTELLWSAAVGAILFSEIPARTTLIGAMVIIPSTMYVVWAESRKPCVDRP